MIQSDIQIVFTVMIHIEVRCYLAILVVITVAVPTIDCRTKYSAKYGMNFVAGDNLEFSEIELKDIAKNSLITLEHIYYNSKPGDEEVLAVGRIIKLLHKG